MRSVLTLCVFFLLPISAVAKTCHTTPETCVQPGGTRLVDGEMVTLPCWKYQSIQTCHFPSDNNCVLLRSKGCHQSDSQCRTWSNSLCVVRDQTYRCPTKKCAPSDAIVCGKETYCMGDHCAPTDAQSNGDFGTAILQMAAIGGAAADIKGSNGVHAFAGHPMECAESFLKFKNCCVGSGWGQDIGLAHCRDTEKALGKLREKGLAVYAGRYCHNDTAVGCTSHHQVYCVFSSKLAQIVQQQGRKAQLHISFGTVGGKDNRVDCRGITPEELSRMHFNAMDFGALLDDIKKNAHLPGASDLETRAEKRIHDFFDKGKTHA